MSRLLVITRPELVAGFQLAGVDAYAARDIETAQELIESCLTADEEILLAIDDGLAERMDPSLIRQLDVAEKIPYLVIPGGRPLGREASRRYQIAEMIRRAIGIHITFKGEDRQVGDR